MCNGNATADGAKALGIYEDRMLRSKLEEALITYFIRQFEALPECNLLLLPTSGLQSINRTNKISWLSARKIVMIEESVNLRRQLR
jgi:hypothetical protein